jgi:hypothetical protein
MKQLIELIKSKPISFIIIVLGLILAYLGI